MFEHMYLGASAKALLCVCGQACRCTVANSPNGCWTVLAPGIAAAGHSSASHLLLPPGCLCVAEASIVYSQTAELARATRIGKAGYDMQAAEAEVQATKQVLAAAEARGANSDAACKAALKEERALLAETKALVAEEAARDLLREEAEEAQSSQQQAAKRAAKKARQKQRRQVMNAPQLHEAQYCMFATAATHHTHIIALLAHRSVTWSSKLSEPDVMTHTRAWGPTLWRVQHEFRNRS